ncbi:MAG TPA: hypothetical protein VEU30_13310, partial [Thermoanaerobaculia bacterium]|nr:hypothetical protein [Thermoanaerobaculia bacterium]
MQLDHQLGRAFGIDLPLADDAGRHAGDEERPREADEPLARADAAARGLARGEHRQARAQIETHDLARLEQSILTGR